MNQTVKNILILVVLAWVTYDSFRHMVSYRWQYDSKHASATPHIHYKYESAASIVHAFTQDGDSGMDDLVVGQKIFKMQCMDDCRAADYSGMHSQPAVMKLMHHLIEAKQMLTEMQHVRGGNFLIWMERLGIDSIMSECHNLISTIFNESASIPVYESDYANQNRQTGHSSASHSQQANASVSDTIESPSRHLPPESSWLWSMFEMASRRSSMFEMPANVTSTIATLQPYSYRSKDIDSDIEGLPSAGIYVVKVDGYKPYTYTGQFRDGLPHGRGMAVSENGYYYEGYFLKGKLNHHGRAIYLSGNVYEGEYHDGKAHGKGRMTFSSGEVYEGEYHDGKAHGKGRMMFSSGDVYEGEWHHDKRHGKGKYTYSYGEVYEGEYQHNKRHGKGKYTFSSGDVYEGEYHDGIVHGKGRMTHSDGSVYEGEYQHNKRHGKGKYTFSSGEVYEGEWQHEKRHGKGTNTFSDGRIYKGEWQHGKAHGKGTLKRKDGSTVTGTWIDGEYKG